MSETEEKTSNGGNKSIDFNGNGNCNTVHLNSSTIQLLLSNFEASKIRYAKK